MPVKRRFCRGALAAAASVVALSSVVWLVVADRSTSDLTRTADPIDSSGSLNEPTTTPHDEQPRHADDTSPLGDAPSDLFVVDSIEVRVRVVGDSIPSRARTVRTQTTVLRGDRGDVACIGPVLESDPPQCPYGVPLEGVDVAGFPAGADGASASHASGVLYAERPVDGGPLLVTDFAASETDGWYPEPLLPDECESASGDEYASRIGGYAGGLAAANGGVIRAAGGRWFLQVVGDTTEHVSALERAGVPDPCVVSVERSLQDLEPLLNQVVGIQGVGIVAAAPGAGGRIDVDVQFADLETIRRISRIVLEPAAIRIIGLAEIGEERPLAGE